MGKEIKQEVLVGVIAGVVVAALTSWYLWDGLSSYVLWPTLNFAWACIVWITSSALFPRWLFYSCLLGTLTFVFLLGWSFWRDQTDSLNCKNFTEIVHFGIRWRWNWYRGNVGTLRPYCLDCDREMITTNTDRYASFQQTRFTCPHCRHGEVELNAHHKDIDNYVRIEIDHALRTDRWKQLVKKDSAA